MSREKPGTGLSTVLAAFAVFCTLSIGADAWAQRPEQGEKPVAEGTRAMASSSHPRVTETILEVLKSGGNAVDAMLTAIPLQHVLEPQMSTLAGGMGGLIYWAETDELVYLDAELDHTRNAPAAGSMAKPESIPTTSGQRIGVPGTVHGLKAAAERFGSGDWANYFGPAIETAENGYRMYSFLYGEASAAYERIGAHPATREIWMPDGFLPPAGDLVVQKELAATLRRLAQEGPDYFTEGGWAQRFVAEVNRTGGSITLEEVAGYEPRWVDPVAFTYRGTEFRGAPPASFGGVLNGMVFNILERLDLQAMGHYTESAESLATIRTAFDFATSQTRSFVSDPKTAQVPVETLLSKELGAIHARLIERSEVTADLAPQKAGLAAPGTRYAGTEAYKALNTDTNHLVIVDEAGNWVSMTHTVYGDTFATGLTVDGVFVNSGNTFPGTGAGEGRRVITPFPALMALDEAGKPWLALGSPGLSTWAVATTVVNMLGYSMEPYAAVDAPRFRGFGRYEPFQVESRLAPEVYDGLAARGIEVAKSAPYNWHMGSIHLIRRDRESGRLTGVADPRRGGHTAGY